MTSALVLCFAVAARYKVSRAHGFFSVLAVLSDNISFLNSGTTHEKLVSIDRFLT